MKTPEDFFRYLEQSLHTLAADSASDQDKIGKAYALVSQFFVFACEDEPLHFTTLFARITHVCTRHHLPYALIRGIQRFRIDAENYLRKGTIESSLSPGDIWAIGALSLHEIASRILGIPSTQTATQLIGRKAPKIPAPGKKGTFKRHAQLVAYDLESDDKLLAFDSDSGEEIHISFNDVGRSELFKENILKAIELIGFPLSLSAIDIEVTGGNHYSPRILVIEPDYLLDISTISECYQESGGDVRFYLPKKYQESRTNPAILIGRIANFFLDELIHDPQQRFEDLFPRSFLLDPVEFATLSDEEVQYMVAECRGHFTNLQNVVTQEFERLGLDRSKMFIEPAFFCPAYGVQGRLDLFATDGDHQHIIELKSGQAFHPNAYGLSSAHYAQTLLYDLMIKTVNDYRTRQTSYILYSRYASNALRYAPPVEAIQREVIRLRNDILLAERALCNLNISDNDWFEKISPEYFPDVKGFLQKNITAFDETWRNLDELEKNYIRIFSRFIAREQFLAKVGIHGSDQVNGLAGIWLDTDEEKEERFAIYRNLSVTDVQVHTNHDAYVLLSKEAPTNALSNFRVGDIAVLYPMLEQTPSVLHTQIYKCTVTELGEGSIAVRLRSRQVSYDDIHAHDKWVLEHDLYDRSFNTMHSALFTLARASSEMRSLYLGLTAPALPEESAFTEVEAIGKSQNDILRRIINAKEYFLLWGPPGTGKTSIILHHLVAHYINHTPERLVLMAYTNRAVDEICDALDALDADIRSKYVRIGSHIGTGVAHQSQLLGQRITGMRRRTDIIEFLSSQRIIVGTISSISGNPDLFRIVKPDIAIIDEASQILEPMLAGLLPLFKKWVLIGDHRQLPAVVAQPVAETKLGADAIPGIGLDDPRDSYFERMYHLCVDRKWDWAYARLTEQGRMHRDIMAFPSRVFYDNQLQMLPKALQGDRDFSGALKTAAPPGDDTFSQMLASERMLWIPSTPVASLHFSKTHDEEARTIVAIVRELMHLYGSTPDIGIITPFRAQIANIRAHLQAQNIDPDTLTIDTVERYQGSARDIIILSLSIHHPAQLQRIVSPSSDGVDRKLNVALTRARNQFILISMRDLGKYNSTYRELCEACVKLEEAPVAEQMES